jgi:nucleotide-binding universal stress UspA family protein
MTARPVLVGTDGSAVSLRAVAWAAREAATHGKPLQIVSVLAPPPRTGSPWSAAAVHEAAQRDARQALGAAAEHASGQAELPHTTTEVLYGDPAMMLTGRAAGASMLVVGFRRAGGLSAKALGSVSRYAATHAACPVVVVRDQGMVTHREIVVGVRDPELPASSAALGFAFAEAALRKARLLAVHAWYWASPDGHRDQPGRPRDTAHRLAEALSAYQDRFPGVEVFTDVARAHPGRVLAGVSAHADMVVVGRHESQDPGADSIGSVTHAVLNHGHGPVAIVADA